MGNHISGQGQGWQGRPYQPQEQAESAEPGQVPVQRGSTGITMIIFGILLALFVPIVGPVTALIMGIVMRKTPGAILLTALGGFFIAFHIVFNFLFPIFPAA